RRHLREHRVGSLPVVHGRGVHVQLAVGANLQDRVTLVADAAPEPIAVPDGGDAGAVEPVALAPVARPAPVVDACRRFQAFEVAYTLVQQVPGRGPRTLAE